MQPEIKDVTLASYLVNLMQIKFGKLLKWPQIELGSTKILSEIPEGNGSDKKSVIISALTRLKGLLIEQEVNEDDLKFLDEEIELCVNTEQISVYHEKEYDVDSKIVDEQRRVNRNTEGMIRIHRRLNYEQLKYITRKVFESHGVVKCFISPEKRVEGSIVNEMYEYPQNISIVSVLQSLKKDDESSQRLSFFEEKYDKKKYAVIKEIELKFRIYRFITTDEQEIILLSTKQLALGSYIISGVVAYLDDFKALTESMKLKTKQPFMFIHSAENKILQFDNDEEFKNRILALKVNYKNMFDYPFTIYDSKSKRNSKLVHPEWFKWLMWSWLLHEKEGLENRYPMHIMMIGPQDAGKSYLLNRLHARSKESKSIFSGSSSTLKNVVPSFKYKPAKIGYLAESNRFAFLDEFLRCVISSKSNSEGGRDESLAMMNDLLEHQKREAGSGISSVKVNMTARALASSNPVREARTMEDMLNKFDQSWLSRWLILFQSKEHVAMIKESNSSELEPYDFDMDTEDFISIVDYLQNKQINYDEKRVIEIYEECKSALSESLLTHYSSRHKHHIKCLFTGLVKTRCLMNNDFKFLPIEEDYNMLREIWCNVIKSWIDIKEVRKIELDRKIFYMPESSQYAFKKLCEEKRPLAHYEWDELVKKELKHSNFIDAVIILKDNGLVTQDSDGIIRPYYMTDEWKDKTK